MSGIDEKFKPTAQSSWNEIFKYAFLVSAPMLVSMLTGILVLVAFAENVGWDEVYKGMVAGPASKSLGNASLTGLQKVVGG